MDELEELLALLEQVVQSAIGAGEEYRQERSRVEADELLSVDGRQQRVAELRQAAVELIEQRRSQAEEVRDVIERSVAQVRERSAPTGAEDVAARIEAADARSRVRSLLEAGANPGEVIRRASALADRTTLEALRAESAWIDAARPITLGEDGTIDTAGLVRSIDEALVPLLPAQESKAAAVGLKLVDEWPAMKVHLDSALTDIEVGPSLGSVLAARYAEGAA